MTTQNEDMNPAVGTTAAKEDAPATMYDAAIAAAHAGQFIEATRLLVRAEELQECTTAEALDLHARMQAQQGLYADAESCWRKARDLDPGNPSYERGIARIRQTSRVGIPLVTTVLATALVAVLGLMMWQTLVAFPTLQGHQSVMSGHLAKLDGDLAEVSRIGDERDRALHGELTRLGNAVGGVSTETDSLRTAAHEAEDRGRELDRRTAAIARRIDESDDRAAERAEDLSRQIKARIAALELQLSGAATAAGMDTMATEMTAIISELSEIRSMIEEISEPESPALSPKD